MTDIPAQQIQPRLRPSAAFTIAFEGECDPRREPERGARLDDVLNAMSDEQLESTYLAAFRLGEAVVCAQLRRDAQRQMSGAS